MKINPLKISVLYLLGFLTLFSLSSWSTNSKSAAYRIKTIVIDAGHGGKASGAVGKHSNEKDVTLQVALRLGKLIENSFPDIKVYYTRTADEFVANMDRSGLANKVKADLFISVHCNSMPHSHPNRTSVRGVETFVAGFGRIGEQDVAIRENADILMEKNYQENYGGYDPNDPESMIIFSLMKNAYREKSFKLATYIQNEYVANGRPTRGVKEQNILVLQRAGMPSVLTEIGFISNPEEEDYMNSESGQTEIAQNILAGILTYKKQVETEY